jgi:hypothetical protein
MWTKNIPEDLGIGTSGLHAEDDGALGTAVAIARRRSDLRIDAAPAGVLPRSDNGCIIARLRSFSVSREGTWAIGYRIAAKAA